MMIMMMMMMMMMMINETYNFWSSLSAISNQAQSLRLVARLMLTRNSTWSVLTCCLASSSPSSFSKSYSLGPSDFTLSTKCKACCSSLVKVKIKKKKRFSSTYIATLNLTFGPQFDFKIRGEPGPLGSLPWIRYCDVLRLTLNISSGLLQLALEWNRCRGIAERWGSLLLDSTSSVHRVNCQLKKIQYTFIS